VVVAVEGDAHLALRPAEQPQLGLGVGGAIAAQPLKLRLPLGRQQFLQFAPAERRRLQLGIGGGRHGRATGWVLF